MAEEKKVPLSIVLGLVDKATGGLASFNSKLERATKPIADFKKQLGELRGHAELLGLDAVASGFKGVGSAISGLLGKLTIVGGAVGLAVHGVLGLVDEFDNLGDTSDKLGVTVDFLAAMRFAAERSGASVEDLDQGLTTFAENMGQLRAGKGRMFKFLSEVAPDLVVMLKATKGNEAAFRLMADAMSKVTDQQKRLALGAKTGLGSALVPMLARGSQGLLELQGEFAGTADSLEDAAEKAGATDDALKNLKAATMGTKAALLSGLAPALTIVIDQLKQFLMDHREDIKRWAADVGEKLPRAVDEVVKSIKGAVEWVGNFVDKIGGWKVAAMGFAAVLAGPLLLSVTNLTGALVSMLARLSALPAALSAASAAGSAAAGAAAGAGKVGVVGVVAQALPPIALGLAGADAFLQKSIEMARGADAPTVGDLANNALFNLIRDKMVTEARVKIDIANAPRGTRATVDPRSTTDVDLTMGVQLAGFGP